MLQPFTLPDITAPRPLQRVRVHSMAVYTLTVCNEGSALPTETIRLTGSAEVLDTIAALLKKHPGCHRIDVHAGAAHLFPVDCQGNNVAD